LVTIVYIVRQASDGLHCLPGARGFIKIEEKKEETREKKNERMKKKYSFLFLNKYKKALQYEVIKPKTIIKY
jgi:hypothetical protein